MDGLHRKTSRWMQGVLALLFVLASVTPAWAVNAGAERGLPDTTAQMVRDGGSRSLVPSMTEPISELILSQMKNTEAPVVVGYEIAHFALNLDDYVNIWRARRMDATFGQKGSGLVSVLLPYAVHKDTPNVLQGIDQTNLPAVFGILNGLASKVAGETVDLGPADFGLTVPSEKLSKPVETKDYIEHEVGYPMTRLFARQAVADAFKGVLKSLVAFVFDLKALDQDVVGISELNAALAQDIKEGFEIREALMVDVSSQDAQALRTARDTLTKF